MVVVAENLTWNDMKNKTLVAKEISDVDWVNMDVACSGFVWCPSYCYV